jgi:GH25 family lysozyme M1 (1,4-beta-N-acetylmuramidase)
VIYGVDVSYSQGLPDWNAAVASGKVQFAFNRACYGTNPADDDGESFVHNHDALKALGVPVGAYQFYLFGQDGAAQAQHFLEAADGRWGTLFPVVDVEEESADHGAGGSLELRVANLAAYSAAIEKGLGC